MCGLLNECLWFANLALKLVEAIPMYALDSVGAVTLHLYTMLEGMQLLSSGHEEGIRQLQVFDPVIGAVGYIFLLFEEEMFCAMFGVVE